MLDGGATTRFSSIERASSAEGGGGAPTAGTLVPPGGAAAGAAPIQPTKTFDDRTAFIVGGVIPLVLAAILWYVLPESPRFMAQRKERWPELPLGIHLHNTNGMALANALAAMDAGATVFEGSICGIGGGIRMPDGRWRS